MQQDEKRRKRGFMEEEVGLILSCPYTDSLFRFGSRHQDRLGWETLFVFDTIRQVNKARPGVKESGSRDFPLPRRIREEAGRRA